MKKSQFLTFFLMIAFIYLKELKEKYIMLIETEMSLLMNYFIDRQMVSER